MAVYVLAHDVILPDSFEEVLVSETQNKKFVHGSITFDTSSPYYPGRSDLKIMRTDTKAAVMSAQRLLAEFDQLIDKSSTALFVATGSFIEGVDKHLGHLLKAFEQIMEADTEEEKLNHIYRSSPPLLALQTLTNSTMSFVAQYAGVKGNNATFGNTSHAGIDAIQIACSEVTHKGNPAMMVASNGGSEISFASNSNLIKQTDKWKESTAAGTLLLGNDKSLALCEVVKVESGTRKNIGSEQIKRNWSSLLGAEKSDAIICSGAYTEAEASSDLAYCNQLNTNSLSSFNDYGNLGAVNSIQAISQGIQLIKNGAKKIDILDRDIYGRESYIQLKKV